MSDREIRESINKITGTYLTDKVHAVEATIISVDSTSRLCVCQVVSGKASNIINDVRLMATADDGLLIIPTIGSSVCVIISDYNDPYISQYSGIDKIILRGGDLGGLVRVINLTTKLNNLESKVNDLVTKFAAHTHTVVSVGSPTSPNLLPVVGSLTPTQQTEIENKLITHG